MNKTQLKKRKDGNNQPCVVTDPFFKEEKAIRYLKPKIIPVLKKKP